MTQCRSRSVGFWRSQLIWIYTVCNAYPASAGLGLTFCTSRPKTDGAPFFPENRIWHFMESVNWVQHFIQTVSFGDSLQRQSAWNVKSYFRSFKSSTHVLNFFQGKHKIYSIMAMSLDAGFLHTSYSGIIGSTNTTFTVVSLSSNFSGTPGTMPVKRTKNKTENWSFGWYHYLLITVNVLKFHTSKFLIKWHMQTVQRSSLIIVIQYFKQHIFGYKYPKHIYCEEIRIKQGICCISFCSLRILYNSKFILLAISL